MNVIKNRKDPVCGMTVDKNDTGFTSSFKGTMYYFCSALCKADFDEDPESLLAMKEAREKSVEEERSASLNKMIDAVAHEIRNPLTSTGGFARKVYKRLPPDDPNREYLEIIIDDVARVEDMVTQIVELKTMGASHPEPANVNNIIHDVVRSFEKELESEKMEVKLELKESPPAVILDAKRIKTAIAGLIKNAIEASEKTPKYLKILTRVKDEAMEITVSDKGKGIPEDKMKYIFDPLHTSKMHGPGLGLTLAKMIVQEHGGAISVKSAPGEGATFTIRLPLMSI